MKYCPNCGSKVEDGFNFCTSCGSKFPESNQPTQQNSSDDLFGFEENKGNSNQTVYQQPQVQPQPQVQKTNTCCLLGLIFAFIFALVGLILSCMGLSQVKNNPNEKGRELAIAGIVISILSMVVSFIISIVTTLATISQLQ